MNQTDIDELLYGNSFTLNGKRIDPRRVTINPDGTWIVEPAIEEERRDEEV